MSWEAPAMLEARDRRKICTEWSALDRYISPIAKRHLILRVVRWLAEGDPPMRGVPDHLRTRNRLDTSAKTWIDTLTYPPAIAFAS